jgi:hypothetical protein
MVHITRRVFATAACTVILTGSAGSAWQEREAQPPVPARAMTRDTSASNPSMTRILGTVWTADSTPIPLARVRLRNMATGAIDGAGVANNAGEFVFPGIHGGPFVVEYVSKEDRVLAIGPAFVVAAGATVTTFVRVGSDKPWYAGFFSNAAIAVVSGAAASGITALAPVQRPASPDRPR